MGAATHSFLVDVLDPSVEVVVGRLLPFGTPERGPSLSLRGVWGSLFPPAGAEAWATGSHPEEA
eukprot:9910834-Heterocapsa_arctica.AAC.1